MSESLRSRLENLKFKAHGLQGRLAELESRNKELSGSVALAKARVAVSDEVDAMLEALQTRTHERSLGIFEKLLTAIVRDVIPDKGEIKLELSTERGLPALHFSVDNEGSSEDILEGSGGAVTNVVTVGLRLAALSRTSNRRLLVLDEADCWIKPSRIHRFAKVVADVSQQAKVQTLVVSHHDLSFFEDQVSYIELGLDADGIVVVQKTHNISEWEDDTQPGIRYIHLKGFKSHHDTKLHFPPGVTALIGDNDLGKSNAISSSLRAVAYGESDDKAIHHDFDMAQVEIGLEQGYAITWTRKRKGSPKVIYTLSKDGEILEEGRPAARGEVPDWVQTHLKVCRVDDLDIQVGSQKKPIFLLDEAPSKRASLLAVGRESSHLHTLIEAYGSQKRKDKEIIRLGETEIARNSLRMYAKKPLDTAIKALTEVAPKIQAYLESLSKIEALGKVVTSLESLTARQNSLFEQSLCLSGLVSEAPVIQETERLERVVRALEKLMLKHEKSKGIKISLAEPPELRDVERLRDIGRRISVLSTLLGKVSVLRIELESAPLLQDTKDLAKTGMALAEKIKDLGVLQKTQMEVAEQLTACEEEKAAFIEEIGGVCPLCENNLEHTHV